VGDKLLRKVHLNQQGLGLKKSQNNGVSKMIYVKIISPCTFDSDHISHGFVKSRVFSEHFAMSSLNHVLFENSE
jgi:hypothetical protein